MIVAALGQSYDDNDNIYIYLFIEVKLTVQ